MRVLVDLGPCWDCVVPLDELEQVSKIRWDQYRLHVECSVNPVTGDTYKFSSNGFDDLSIREGHHHMERDRIMGFAAGMLSHDDAKNIVAWIGRSTGTELDYHIPAGGVDIGVIRKAVAETRKEPYFKFWVEYDTETEQIIGDSDYNRYIADLIPEWVDETTLALVNDLEERLLIVAADALNEMSMSARPESQIEGRVEGDIPAMGTPVIQKVDLDQKGMS